jgi:hypothetical protein
MTVFTAQSQLACIERKMNVHFNAAARIELKMANCRIHEDHNKLVELGKLRDKALARMDQCRASYSELESLAICLAAC